MGTIAEKLTYLGTTKTMLRDSLNKFGSNISTTDTFRSYDTKLNDIYDKLPKVTQSGAGFTLSDVQNGLVDDFKMNGVDLSQSGTPTPDNPQEIKVVENRQVIANNGKNLLNNQMTSQTLSGVTFTVNNDKSISMQGTASQRVEPILWEKSTNDTLILKAGETYYNYSGIRLIIYGNSNYYAISNNEAYVPAADINVNQIYFRVDTDETVNTTIYPMLTKINNTNYEPYHNPANYNIDLHSKNIFDGQYEDGYYNTANGIKPATQDPLGYRSTNLNEVKPLSQYIISINEIQFTRAIRLFYYDKFRSFLSTETITNGIFTTPSNCYFIAWHSSALKQDYSSGIPNMMIENSPYVTSYEEYYNYKLAKMPDANLKNRIYKSNGNWYFEKNVEKVGLNGSENWKSTSAYTGYYRFSVSINDTYGETIPASLSIKGMNTRFTQRIDQAHGDYEYLYLQYTVEGKLNCYIQLLQNKLSSSDVSSFKTWLSSNNVDVWYLLQTPVTTQITNTTLINQLESIAVHTGTNIFTITNDNNIIPEIEITRLKELEKLA